MICIQDYNGDLANNKDVQKFVLAIETLDGILYMLADISKIMKIHCEFSKQKCQSISKLVKNMVHNREAVETVGSQKILHNSAVIIDNLAESGLFYNCHIYVFMNEYPSLLNYPKCYAEYNEWILVMNCVYK